MPLSVPYFPMLLELLKVLLNILLLACARISWTPPNRPPRREEQARAPDSRAIRALRATRRASAFCTTVSTPLS
jgi:hypothetical protein